MKDEKLPKGRVWPLGASCHDGGVNFALFSSGARSVTLCVFDTDGHETHRYAMNGPVNNVWHGFLPNTGTGLIYGYRVDGPYDPSRGLRYNPARLLLDPYARRLQGQFQWHESHLDRPDTQMDDNAAYMPKAVVTGVHEFDWEGDRRPNIPMCESVIYEVHVKGFTQSHPDVPAELRGTYEGMASPAAIAHLKRLGVTAVELLPVQESVSEGTLIEMGLCNYWGYNTLAFFAPDRRFARQDPVNEFRHMVKELHRHGIEVILDVVYNHTPEGDQRGPTLSWRGLDNQAYYHLSRQDPAYYANYTGTGNSVNASNYVALQMIMDSLRYWVQEMHVDGFRFDLASVLGRVALPNSNDPGRFDRYAPFFQAVRQDPALAGIKLIALGRGRRRLPAGRLSAGLERVERPLPRHDALFLASTPQGPRRLCQPDFRCQRAVPSRWPLPAIQHQLHHLARRLHAERSGFLQPEAQRAQRRGQPRRPQRQPQLERRGGRPY